MLNGYLIERYNNMGNIYTSAHIVEEAKKIGIHMDIIGANDTYLFNNNIFNQGRQLEHRDIVINRYHYGNIKDEINLLADKCYNNLDYYKPLMSKYNQLCTLNSQYFKKPKFLLGTAQMPYDELRSILDSEFVVKGLKSSKGHDVFLIKDNADYIEFQNKNPKDTEFLFEEFISESFGKDLRLLCLRGETIACMKRQSKGDFRANVALGAEIETYPITRELAEIGKEIYGQTHLDVVGVDLLFGKDGFYFCEINGRPGLQGIESVSNVNIAKEFVEIIAKDFK